MERNDVFSGKEIEITRSSQDKRIAISRQGIEIRREGRPVSFEVPAIGFVYMVVDCSTSMEGDKLSQAKNGTINFAEDALKKGFLTGLIQFESVVTHLCEPIKEISALERCLKQIEAGGGTNMAEAIQVARQRLGKKKELRVVVIVTDGAPDSKEEALNNAQKAKDEGIEIITIGTDDADRSFLKKIASREDLGIKVAKEKFKESIASAAKVLPQLNSGGKRR